MSQLVERKGFKIESTLPKKKKHKEKKIKPVEQVKIIDDDAPIPWNSKTSSAATADDELASFEDAPVVVGIVDERPKDIREKERFNDSKRWRTAAFEEIPPAEAMGPHPHPGKSTSSSSRQERNSSDDSDPDVSRRRRKGDDDPDLSPPRRRTQHRRNQSDDDPSPPRRRRNQSDDDPSPPRRRDQSSSRSRHDDPSPPRRKIKDEPDASPPRRKHKHRDDDDRSPPRRRDRSSPSRTKDYRSRVKNEPQTPQIEHRPSSKRRDSSPPRNERPTSNTTAPAKSERRRLAEHKEEVAERYAAWGRGLAQVKQSEEAVKDYIEQSQKPLARYRDDQDLDAVLKNREREDDPMLKYLTPKTSEQGDRSGGSGGSSAPPKPRYRGPDPQKNRFDIWPGYRWDGVDRSNGYERRLFESIASRHAKAQEAYLWSVEDM